MCRPKYSLLLNVNDTLNPQVKSSVIEVSQLVIIKSAVHSVSVPEKKIRFLYVQKVCPFEPPPCPVNISAVWLQNRIFAPQINARRGSVEFLCLFAGFRGAYKLERAIFNGKGVNL